MAVSEAGTRSVAEVIEYGWGRRCAKSVDIREGTFCRVGSSGVPEAFTPRSLARDPYFIQATHSTVHDRLTRELSIGGYIGASKCLFIWMQHGVASVERPIFPAVATISLIIICLSICHSRVDEIEVKLLVFRQSRKKKKK